jgi:hypothetical protein
MADMQSPHIRALFQHLLQRYGDARTQSQEEAASASASAASSAGSGASSSPGALIAGYPEFLQHILPQL